MKEKTGRLKGFWKKITQNPDLIFGIGMIVAALFLSWRAWRGRDQGGFWIFAILMLVILAGVFWGG